MHPLAKNIKKYRKAKGLSQQDLANHFGYKSFTTIQKWEDGSSQPPAKTLERLSALLGVSMNDLMIERNVERVPVLGRVRGGLLRYAEEEWIGEEWVDPQETTGGLYFYLEVEGDSMINARIYPGDLVYVRKTDMVDSGAIAVVLVNDETTLKRVYFRNGKLILHPENPDYDDIVFSEDDLNQNRVEIIGEVIHSKIKFK